MGVGSGRVVVFVSSFGWEFVCAVLDWIQLWENLLVCVREWVYGGGYFEDMIICVGVMRRCEWWSMGVYLFVDVYRSCVCELCQGCRGW